jgi:TRAP-type C4-dicarboxylate transport system permease small subunit
MQRSLSIFATGLAAIARIELYFGCLLFLNIIVNIGAQVFSRYVLNYPLIWVEELATYSFIWACFIGASLALKYQRHIKIDTFVACFNARTQAAFRLLAYGGMLILLVVFLSKAWLIMELEGRSSSISLPITLPRSMFSSYPLFVSSLSMVLTCLYYLAQEIRYIASLHPIEPVPLHAWLSHDQEE